MHSVAIKSRKGRTAHWSYHAGEWGVNRVRVFEKASGLILLSWWEKDSRGKLARRTKSLGHRDQELAKRQAEEVVARLRSVSSAAGALTLGCLTDRYLREVTPEKSASMQQHERAAAEMFGRFFGRDRRIEALGRGDWDRFIRERRRGAIRPTGASARGVRARQVAYDLSFLTRAMNWASTLDDGRGRRLLDRNPWKGLSLPGEENPRRPSLPREQYAQLLKVSREVHPYFWLALVLCSETGHRLNSVRQLRWSDIDFDWQRARWRAESDKIGFEHSVPLTECAVAALAEARAAQRAIGDAWVFPALLNESEPCGRRLFLEWWHAAEELAGIEHVHGRAFHSTRRAFATDLKQTPLKDLAYLGGWKDPATILKCYQQPDEETMRSALAGRTFRKAIGLSK